MTKTDLHLIYKRETGLDVPKHPSPRSNLSEIKKFLDYVSWLEEKLINLYNS